MHGAMGFKARDVAVQMLASCQLMRISTADGARELLERVRLRRQRRTHQSSTLWCANAKLERFSSDKLPCCARGLSGGGDMIMPEQGSESLAIVWGIVCQEHTVVAHRKRL